MLFLTVETAVLLIVCILRCDLALYPDVKVPEEVVDANVFKINDEFDKFFVTSPNYPENYPDSTRTAYWFQGNGKAVTLNANAFQLQTHESDNSCKKDYIVIWDLLHPHLVIKVACGNALFHFKSYSDSVMVLFVSDASQNFKGFNFTLTRTVGCAESELTCPSSLIDGPVKCVNPEHICDGQRDCGDGEDEICSEQCGRPVANVSAMASKSRIIGGLDAEPNAWPWQVDVKIANATCGGSLVGPRWVVTAGHCCKEYGVEFPLEQYTLRLGYTSCQDKQAGQSMTIADRIVHPNYTEGFAGSNYDYCLLFLNENVITSAQVQPICLPRPGTTAKPGAVCTATGCGNIVQWSGQDVSNTVKLPNQLQAVNLTVVNGSECVRSYDTLTPEMMCATAPNKDTCQGDSGGPLSCQSDPSNPSQYFLQGVTSYGFGCASGKPGVFADVRRMLPFLIQTLYDNKEGWHSNVTVPAIPHRSHPEPTYQPRVLVTLPAVKTEADLEPENAGGHLARFYGVSITLCCLSLVVMVR